MSDEIKVTVFQRGDRRNLMMHYRDPLTGKEVVRSTGKTTRREAERVAATWEKEVLEGGGAHSRISWADFRQRYEDEVLPGLAESTEKKVFGVFNAVERILNPKRLRDITAARLSHLQSKLREEQSDEQTITRAESTIKGHMAHLLAALKWAKRVGLIHYVPEMPVIRRAKSGKVMKGRPITREEFERMLAKVPSVVGDECAPSWTRYLEGLWLSGLRLKESLELWWDRDDRLCVDLSGKRPMLRIPAELEKGHKDRLLPMAPEFAEFLLRTPEHQRHGRVFEPRPQRIKSERISEVTVGRTVGLLGEKAGIKVLTDPVTGAVKFASAHDLRRSFGARWAARVMPQVLQELMRHESIETTMKYYVGRQAESTADILWAAHDASAAVDSANTRAKSTRTEEGGESQVVSAKEVEKRRR